MVETQLELVVAEDERVCLGFLGVDWKLESILAYIETVSIIQTVNDNQN